MKSRTNHFPQAHYQSVPCWLGLSETPRAKDRVLLALSILSYHTTRTACLRGHFNLMRQIIFSIVVVMLCTAASCNHSRRTSLDETERLRAATLSNVNQVVKPTPVVVETTSADGTTTSVTTAPESTTTHNLSDNTTASSTASWKTSTTIGLGVSALGNVALILLAYVLYSKFTMQGQVVDRALAYATRRATSINNADRREDLMHIQNILDR